MGLVGAGGPPGPEVVIDYREPSEAERIREAATALRARGHTMVAIAAELGVKVGVVKRSLKMARRDTDPPTPSV